MKPFTERLEALSKLSDDAVLKACELGREAGQEEGKKTERKRVFALLREAFPPPLDTDAGHHRSGARLVKLFTDVGEGELAEPPVTKLGLEAEMSMNWLEAYEAGIVAERKRVIGLRNECFAGVLLMSSPALSALDAFDGKLLRGEQPAKPPPGK